MFNLPFSNLNDIEVLIVNSDTQKHSTTININPNSECQGFIDSCDNLSLNDDDNDDGNMPLYINSSYHNIEQINAIKPDPSSSFGVIHTNLASIDLHFDDLLLSLSLIDIKFNIIGFTEHKIRKNKEPLKNISLKGYHPFIYQPTETTHGGAGLFIDDNLSYKVREDLNLNSPGNFETTLVELIIPNKKNVVIGCIYHHPGSLIPIDQFTSEFLEPILKIISTENKTASLMGDFNIDLLKRDSKEYINDFYNSMSSHIFSPFILQPTRPISKTLIDNIFFNTLEYKSTSGNLTIQLADHLFQFVIVEGFFEELPIPKKIFLGAILRILMKESSKKP